MGLHDSLRLIWTTDFLIDFGKINNIARKHNANNYVKTLTI
jgi:hypothetical protein